MSICVYYQVPWTLEGGAGFLRAGGTKAVLVSNCRASPPLGKDVIFIMSQLCVNVYVCACTCRDHALSRKKDLDRSSDLPLANLLS